VRHYGQSTTWYDRAHNAFLDYAVSGGIVLLLAYLSIFILVLKTIFRDKDRWAIIAGAWFLMVVIQGMTIFEVLPVYIQFFILCAFFVNTNGLNDERKKRNYTYNFSPNAATVILFGVIILAVLYIYTINNTLEKNKLLIKALRDPQGDFSKTFEYFDDSLSFNSFVGQGEAAESYLRTLENAVSGYSTTENASLPEEAAAFLTSKGDDIYNKNKDIFISSRPLLILGNLNLSLGRLTRDSEYSEKGAMYCNSGLERAPDRIEFLICLSRASQDLSDEETFNKIISRIAELRPDLLKNIPN